MHQTVNLLSLLGLVAWGDFGPTTIFKTQKGKNVQYAKTWPEKPPTLHSAASRVRFAMAAEAWKNLHHKQQEIWVRCTKINSLTMCGIALYMSLKLKMRPGGWTWVKDTTHEAVWPEVYVHPGFDAEPIDRWGDTIRYPFGDSRMYGSPVLSVQPPEWRVKMFSIIWDPVLHIGAAQAPVFTVDGPGTVDTWIHYNGCFTRWWFNSTALEATTHVTLTYTSVSRSTYKLHWYIRTQINHP